MPAITRSQSLALVKPTKPSLPPSRSPSEEASSNNVKLYTGFWPCQSCSCRKANFEKFVDNCLTCGHTMYDHEPDRIDPWNPGCDYVCPRDKLVAALLTHVRQYGSVVIRATPMVGKSVLLKLLGHHIVHREPDLEPIFLNWQTRAKRDGLPYLQYLEREERLWRQQNSKVRSPRPSTRNVYLIDEAQDSYEEDDFWSILKNHHNTRNNPLYVLVCVYGTDVIPAHRYANIESQARKMHSLQRVELRRTGQGIPCMLFTSEEMDIVFRKFAKLNGYTFGPGVQEYLRDITQGHPGIIGTLLAHVHQLFWPGRKSSRELQDLTLKFIQNRLLRGEDSFVEWLGNHGRGIWCPRFEYYVKQELKEREYHHLSLTTVKKALCEVAKQQDGLTRMQTNFDEFAFCHKMGLLHAERSTKNHGETTFVFASPLHRKVAYRRLLGPEPDAIWPDFSLQQICMNAISRFSPEAFKSRQRTTNMGNWRIPERAFQAEMHLCLTLELSHLPILTEYPIREEGRIDLFILDRQWGIEILRCGNQMTIDEHIARFMPTGKYNSLEMNDYIVINFCSRSNLPNIRIEETESRSHLFHVVVEPDEYTAEFYSYDSKLLGSWSLGEGRKRLCTEDEFDISIKEPVPTPREMKMEMDELRFRSECAEEEARLAKEKIQLLMGELERHRAQEAEMDKRTGPKLGKRKR